MKPRDADAVSGSFGYSEDFTKTSNIYEISERKNSIRAGRRPSG